MLNSAEAMKAKITWLIKESGRVTPAALRKATGMKHASGVSEWLRTGRIDKRHIPTIALLTGISERWWLTPSAPIPPTGAWLTPTAREDTERSDDDHRSVVAFRQTQQHWPFKFERSRFDRLNQRDKDRVEGAALNIIIECERGAPDRRKSRGGAG